MTAELDGRYVVFLVGMRVNRPWRFWVWWPIYRAMVGMIGHLRDRPELGLLGHHVWPGRTVLVLQYWRSYEQLEAFASGRLEPHLPAWARFTRKVAASGDVGIWHETFLVSPGGYEAIYHNMPPFGLGKVGRLMEAAGGRNRARGRIEATSSELSPENSGRTPASASPVPSA